MTLHRPEEGDHHPERPHRIAAMYQHLLDAGIARRCTQIKGRECTEEEVLMVHSLQHWQQVHTSSAGVARGCCTQIGADTYCNEFSALCARMATGTVAEVCRRVLRGEAANGAALVRPPGHHAEHETIMGFCFFNYVAVAAEIAKREFGLQRVLILDWDVHHGNGTQSMFFKDPSVLYISLHRYEDGNFYPGTGGAHEVGVGAGRGFNINIPWPHDEVGDAEYLMAFESIVMPVARSFNPELVLVSAGFDAADGDPLGGCSVTPYGYAMMTNMLRGLAGGKVVVALEGGYNLRSIANSMEGPSLHPQA
ncbi:hypothetical protein GUITHDRAFT_157988 [Guillardia theta CCMP2712]|uniref:histone deacetylase n=1 Tax=Guillardia theta (strain CCMP2712) TaxID=905079 RepID=L1J646_GUITC|nr:hypothetical protein GUITHDRAFT_157988 [Guillardia theta CCMP2712]EKX43986.1 hypothetical protein GUITHDRAFT_157988 [Guillardia theta CCMP2712]|eukprot:XP_005830966.1 hypothetical protein GUITHDRAFT_157988 [Guillardia theta CCMP2712]